MIGSPSLLGRFQARPAVVARGVERTIWAATVATAVVLLGIVVALSIYGFVHRNEVYAGVSVAGVDLGGLTRAEATTRLEAVAANYGATTITVGADDQAFQTTPAQLGFDLDTATSIDAAFAFGRDGSVWSRSQSWVSAIIHGRPMPAHVQVDQGALSGYVDGLATTLAVTPTDATVDMSGSAPVIQPEAAGRSLDTSASETRLLAALGSMQTGTVAVVTQVLQPAVTAASLQGALPQAVAATDAPFSITGASGAWSIDQPQLSAIVSVDPTSAQVVVDRTAVEATVSSIAGQVNRDAVNASIQQNDDGTFTVVPGQDDIKVDVERTTDEAVQAIASGADSIQLTIDQTPPAITDAMATAAIAEVNGYLGGITLTWDGGKQTLDRSDLLQALVIFDTGGDPYLFQFDSDVLASLLAPSLDRVDQPAVDARFRIVNGVVTQTEHSKSGHVVDRDATVQAVVDAIYGHRSEVKMTVVADKPTVTDDMMGSISTPDMLAQGITYYTGSSEPRRQNVERAAALEDGWLVAPGAVFSYDEMLGAVDPDNGFATGYGIVADEDRGGVTTAPVMGGGICQVSTTIFQAAWWTGLEVVERYQHPYWLTGYGVAPLGREGLDAMVDIEDGWSLDLKLRNNTGNWIAFVITADGDALTVSLMGTDPGWTVDVSDPVETGHVDAGDDVEYADSPELPAGQQLQVETAHDGFSVRVDRTVTDADGNEILSDSVSSDYAPSRNLILQGTGSVNG